MGAIARPSRKRLPLLQEQKMELITRFAIKFVTTCSFC